MTMMASLKRWINDVAQQEDASSRVDLSLATAVLLCEVIRADYRLDDSEIHLMRSQLKEQFELEDEALDELMTLAREEAEGAECERGEAVFGRAVRREIGRGWNAGVDAVFGAGVRALSERRL